MSGQTAPLRPVNNMRCKMPHEETRSRWPSFSTIAKVSCLVVPIIAYLGQGFITQRPVCIEWNKEVVEAEWWAATQKGWYDKASNTYRDRLKLKCDWFREHSDPLMNPLASNLCKDTSCRTWGIPRNWQISYEEDLDSICEGRKYDLSHWTPEMDLSCTLRDLEIAEHVYKRRETILNNTLAAKPLLCSRVEKV